MTRVRPLFLVALAFALASCAPPRTAAPSIQPPARTLTFMAGYKAQANLPFVGVYVANDMGYFAEQGLRVDVQHSTGQGEHLKLLLQGTVDVTTADADAVLKAGEGMTAKREAYTKHAIDQSVFGAPFFVIDGERFWGQDRLEFVERKLAT